MYVGRHRGLTDVKRELKELVQYPVEHPEKFEKLACRPGVLFYGPPCAEDAHGRAVANECQHRQREGSRVADDVVRRVRRTCAHLREGPRQRAVCPVLRRIGPIGSAWRVVDDGGGAADRVINQIPTEIDGVG